MERKMNNVINEHKLCENDYDGEQILWNNIEDDYNDIHDLDAVAVLYKTFDY